MRIRLETGEDLIPPEKLREQSVKDIDCWPMGAYMLRARWHDGLTPGADGPDHVAQREIMGDWWRQFPGLASLT